jgi:hypothetical protein
MASERAFKILWFYDKSYAKFERKKQLTQLFGNIAGGGRRGALGGLKERGGVSKILRRLYILLFRVNMNPSYKNGIFM